MEKTWKFSATLERMESSLLWHSFILVPEEVCEEVKGLQSDRRVVATFNGEVGHHAAMMPKGDGRYFIMLNKELRKQLFARYGSRLEVELRLDKSRYGMPMAEEMEAVLAEDPVASRWFEALTPGKQRALIHIVSKVKNPDLRIRKSLVIADHLVRQNGELDFRQLNRDFKESK